MIKITNKQQLELFLKTISKDATKQARSMLFESPDPYIDRFESNLKDEMEELQEQEDAEEPAEDEPEEDAEAEAEAEEAEETEEPAAETEPEETESKETNKKNPAAEKALALLDYEEGFDVSFENVITALNTLRAGKSTKNKKIKTELNDYYERLSEDERGVLLLYLNELSKVLTGAVEGEDAQDPSEPSTYFNIRKRDEDEPDPDTVQDAGGKKAIDKPKVSPEPSAVPNQQKGIEDTTPPIKVNESQDIRQIYKKFKKINS